MTIDTNDNVNHPNHYTGHPSGIECIQITENMTFCAGNAFKYLFRHRDKGNALEDLKKARWYMATAMNRRDGVWLHTWHGELGAKVEKVIATEQSPSIAGVMTALVHGKFHLAITLLNKVIEPAKCDSKNRV